MAAYNRGYKYGIKATLFLHGNHPIMSWDVMLRYGYDVMRMAGHH